MQGNAKGDAVVRTKDPDWFAAIIVPPLIFLSGFASYILYHDYGAFAREVVVCYAGLTVFGLLVGVLLAKAGPSNLRAFGIAVLLLLFLDRHLNILKKVHEFLQVSDGQLLRYAVFLLGSFVAFLVVLSLRKRIATVTAVCFATILVTTVAIPTPRLHFGPRDLPPSASSASDLPPIIHVILDGHIGIEGVPTDIEGGPELRDALADFYDRWGFRVFGRAYSKYFMTYNSLSNLLNGTASEVDTQWVAAGGDSDKRFWWVTRNLFFQQAAEKGYRTRIYQSDHLDFCRERKADVELCYVDASSSPRLVRNLDLPVMEKAELVLGSYISKSSAYNALYVYYEKLRSLIARTGSLELPRWERKNYSFPSVNAPAILRRVRADISDSPHGRVFFAHILLPHAPFVWDRECRLRADSDTWLNRRSEPRNFLSTGNPEYRATAYRIYFEQTHCLTSLLNDVLETIDELGLLEEATIIIHGDHGSRITIADPVAPMADVTSSRDFIDAFSTLFAIRSPTVSPGYNGVPRSIQGLFAELVLGVPPPEEDGMVLLQKASPSRRPMQPAPMPPF